MKMRIVVAFTTAILLCAMTHECDADNPPASDVVISEVPAEADVTPTAERWTGNNRPEGVSAYGAVKPVQLPVEYSGKAIDAVVSGIGRILTFPFTTLSHKLNSKNTGGNQHGEEKS